MSTEPAAKRQRTCSGAAAEVEDLKTGFPGRQVSDASTAASEATGSASCDSSGDEAVATRGLAQPAPASTEPKEVKGRALTSGPIGVFDWGTWPAEPEAAKPRAVVTARGEDHSVAAPAPLTMREILELPLAAF
mmetsp:Transcript_33491/g.106186  ORF Transcript_33491/g.106186 Transcript_33491/m.106186 type:complete len:134 (+) Transcript_33491:102-503(+)